jgi:uncharacterized protein
MDVLRGVALLGILIANVTSFGLPEWAYLVPLGTSKPVFIGSHAHLNTIFWFLRWLLVEGKMRGLFSMLFGAGVILLTSRAEQRGAQDQVADIFLRRNMWLVLFGLAHAYLLWFGDILYWYGLTAILFLYPFRRLKPKTLVLACMFVLCLNFFNSFFGGSVWLNDMHLQKLAVAAHAAEVTGKPLTDAQTADLHAWTDREQAWKPDAKMIQGDMAATHAGYLSDRMKEAPGIMQFQSQAYYMFGFCDMLSMMLLGMALCKNGFLTGELSSSVYRRSAVLGLLISLPVVGLATWKAWASGFDLVTTEKWLFLTYDLGRVSGALAIASIVLLVMRTRFLPWLIARVAAVGQTALSNYLLTSLACQVVFRWGPWKLYGQLEYYQLYYAVAVVWCLNLVWSPVWLRYFAFGPVEWLWRSLTYWKKQPMRLRQVQLAHEERIP